MVRHLLFAMLALMSVRAYAFEDAVSELQGFEAYSDILPGDSFMQGAVVRKAPRQKSIIPMITSAIPEAAAYNISNAEQVFCYRVAKRPKDYTGYTLSSFMVTGYCGELDNSNIVTAYEALFTQGPNIITAQANCKIEPQMMLRFVRGVDYTDVLLSNPCPSFTVFYGGRYKAFNIKQGVISDLIAMFDEKQEGFNSPALLKQTVANGAPTTDKERDVLEKKKKEHQPVMNWKKQTEPAVKSEEDVKPKSGWGNIKLRK
ncbi:MAG: hypothetical protein NC218_07110 [Acetobacter sp.]|nr:hypothetical protein [Acetobacter sp.]